jgi:CDP-glucose 4,6-dehydratase
MNAEFWRDKKVFITGHTGFKGSWLSLWLQELGAKVFGFSIGRISEPSLYETAQVEKNITSLIGDIRNPTDIEQALLLVNPDIVIHMAAQALVRKSYIDPVETFATNIMGTVNLLQAVRQINSVRVVVNVTSDKCYENREWIWGYRENDPMGGYDPYSCSKGCAELIISSFRRSFFSIGHMARIASVRAGNVIGGGDWAADRIVPDSIRAIIAKQNIIIHSPQAIRPWQHVLEPLTGYLTLAQKLWEDGSEYADGWNFGPNATHLSSVQELVSYLCRLWGNGASWKVEQHNNLHEAHFLKLDSSKAAQILGWNPVLNIYDTLAMTVEWYKRFYNHEDPRKITLEQIARYQKRLSEGNNGVS